MDKSLDSSRFSELSEKEIGSGKVGRIQERFWNFSWETAMLTSSEPVKLPTTENFLPTMLSISSGRTFPPKVRSGGVDRDFKGAVPQDRFSSIGDFFSLILDPSLSQSEYQKWSLLVRS